MAVKTTSCCFPHAGGDVSIGFPQRLRGQAFSPRRWGCFFDDVECEVLFRVFPTQVGMFLESSMKYLFADRFPHAGGDVSVDSESDLKISKFSPRRWGCFSNSLLIIASMSVFPTQVGMFLACMFAVRISLSFPHAGGDVSGVFHEIPFRGPFSPRRWGCF